MADAETVDDERNEKPEKRKIDLPSSVDKAQEDGEDKADSNKKQKTETPSEKNGSVSVAAGENVAEVEEHLKIGSAVEEEEEEEDEEDDDDYNAEQDEDRHEEAENVDKKGKGILLDDKGKGKMLADSEDDDSEDLDDEDDDDDSTDDSDCDLRHGLDDSDMEDDPLAEVDLDNILPSRTRQRRAQPGVRISSDPQKGNDA